jgi:hypothetical protein
MITAFIFFVVTLAAAEKPETAFMCVRPLCQ